MFISKCYKYKQDSIIYVGGIVPKKSTILETMDILNAEKGYKLKRIGDEKILGNSIWLRNGDVQENYIEVEESIDDNNN